MRWRNDRLLDIYSGHPPSVLDALVALVIALASLAFALWMK